MDKYSFEFKFAKPYGAFIESEVSLWPGTYSRLMLPKYYLEKYHKTYAKEADILTFMKQDKYTTIQEWPEFFSTSNCIFQGMPLESYHIMLDEYHKLAWY